MKTYSRLTLAFLLLILVVPPVVGKPPENGPYVKYYENAPSHPSPEKLAKLGFNSGAY